MVTEPPVANWIGEKSLSPIGMAKGAVIFFQKKIETNEKT